MNKVIDNDNETRRNGALSASRDRQAPLGSRAASVPGALPGLGELWQETRGDAQIRVAILDGPVDLSHDCFAGASIEKLPTVVPETGPSDHGTHVASLICGQGGKVAGVAPDCHVLILPIFTQAADGTLWPSSQTDLARAVTQAVDAGAQIINISGGELTHTGEAIDFLKDAVQYAAERNVLIVSAAGNDGCECLHVPAALPSVLAVGALDVDGNPLGSSNWGSGLEGIMAPGSLVSGAVPGGRVAPLSGTSFATPLVSGVAALLLSLQKKRGLAADPAAVRSALLDSARPCDPQKVRDCRRLLRGVLNVSGARELVSGPESPRESKKLSLSDPSFQPFQGVDMNETTQSVPSQDLSSVKSAALMPSGGETGASAQVAPACIANPAPTTAQDVQVSSEIPAAAALTSTSVAPQATASPSIAPAPTAQVVAPAAVSAVRPSCNNITTFTPFPSGQKAFTLGRLYYDFGTEARRDYFVAQIRAQYEREGKKGFNPGLVYDPKVMADFLSPKESGSAPLPGMAGITTFNHMDAANGLIWTLYIDQDPVYALVPQDQYAVVSFVRLVEFLRDQVDSKDPETFRVALGGTITGNTPLLNGTVVPTMGIIARGMFDWDIEALLGSISQKQSAKKGADDGSEGEVDEDLKNFLLRIYYELRNLGVTSPDRAKNFAATNAYQAKMAFEWAVKHGYKLDTISVQQSPICRRNSDCWDIGLTFFDPKDLFGRAREVYEYTVDVSDIIPVQVGAARRYQIYGGPKL